MYLLAFGDVLAVGLRSDSQRADFMECFGQLNDACFYMVLGVIIGGWTCGYALFYGLEQFLDDPLWLFRIWEGGMSFHGGSSLGLSRDFSSGASSMVAGSGLPWIRLRRFVPLGLGLGRIGNFINTELPGRVTDSALGVHFPCFQRPRPQLPLCRVNSSTLLATFHRCTKPSPKEWFCSLYCGCSQ